ncbi:MAG: hypothetical protein ACLQG3_04930 [Terracidiphilus sp.]
MKSGLSGMAVALLALAPLTGCVQGPSCNTVTDGAGTPSLAFTHVPGLGSTDNLSGQVAHVAPADDYVAVYIHVGTQGWWIKPTFADPKTTLACDGSWTADVTTGGDDTQADTLVAFLLPDDFTPPELGGEADLPQTLYTNAIADASVTR